MKKKNPTKTPTDQGEKNSEKNETEKELGIGKKEVRSERGFPFQLNDGFVSGVPVVCTSFSSLPWRGHY